jgi:hypothetical protein
MAATMIKVFDYFSDANNARQALLASGFPSSCLHLLVSSDEAGKPESQFAVADTSNAAIEGVFSLLSGAKPSNDNGRHQSSPDGMYRLGVEIDGEQRSEQALVILQRFGAADARH